MAASEIQSKMWQNKESLNNETEWTQIPSNSDTNFHESCLGNFQKGAREKGEEWERKLMSYVSSSRRKFEPKMVVNRVIPCHQQISSDADEYRLKGRTSCRSMESSVGAVFVSELYLRLLLICKYWFKALLLLLEIVTNSVRSSVFFSLNDNCFIPGSISK